MGSRFLPAIFTALSANDKSTRWLDEVITFTGQDNLAFREAMIALAFNLLMTIAAVISIMLTIPPRNPARDKTTA